MLCCSGFAVCDRHPAEDALKEWSHHHGCQTVNDDILKAAGVEHVSFVFGLEVAGRDLEELRREDEKKAREKAEAEAAAAEEARRRNAPRRPRCLGGSGLGGPRGLGRGRVPLRRKRPRPALVKGANPCVRPSRRMRGGRGRGRGRGGASRRFTPPSRVVSTAPAQQTTALRGHGGRDALAKGSDAGPTSLMARLAARRAQRGGRRHVGRAAATPATPTPHRGGSNSVGSSGSMAVVSVRLPSDQDSGDRQASGTHVANVPHSHPQVATPHARRSGCASPSAVTAPPTAPKLPTLPSVAMQKDVQEPAASCEVGQLDDRSPLCPPSAVAAAEPPPSPDASSKCRVKRSVLNGEGAPHDSLQALRGTASSQPSCPRRWTTSPAVGRAATQPTQHSGDGASNPPTPSLLRVAARSRKRLKLRK